MAASAHHQANWRTLSALSKRAPRGTARRLQRRRRAFGRLRIAGAVLIFIVLARAGVEFLPRFVDYGRLVSSNWTSAGLLPDWIGMHGGGRLALQAGQSLSLKPYRQLLTSVDTVPVWVSAGAVGLLLMGAHRRPRRRGVGYAAMGLPNLRAKPVAVAKRIPGSELAGALGSCKGALAGVALFSAMSNVLMLTGAMFMLQVYDRVLPSRSVPTLVGISILASLLFIGQAVIDVVRSRIMTRIGGEIDEAVGGRVFSAITRLPLVAGQQGDGLQPQRDLDSIRTFLSSAGPTALFDLPWLPFYLAIIWSFHPTLGMTAICGTIVLVTLTAATEAFTRKPMGSAVLSSVRRNSLAEASRRNAEVLAAMGMGRRLHDHWRYASRQYLAQQQRVSDIAGGFGSVARVLRLMLQSAMLGMGAWLVIHGEATAGIIIAGSILAGRALAPVDLAIAHWRNFVGARQSWRRLSQLLARLPQDAQPMALPAPRSNLTVERVTLGAPGAQRIIVQGIEFRLEAGSVLGIIGPSGSGKSSLVRGLVGAWRPLAGRIKLDGAALDQWSSERLGRYVGYLPQDVELFAGTVAANIARFDPEPDANAIVAAARSAGIHELIVSLVNGYETQIGEGGAALSAGQRQRVALARALYGDPFLVVLDEPNSNLDIEGDIALGAAILGVKARGGIVVMVAHRQNILTAADFVLSMKDGQMNMFGPRERVLPQIFNSSVAMPRGRDPVLSSAQLAN
jgi:ATP-binding cassette subfamily C protein